MQHYQFAITRYPGNQPQQGQTSVDLGAPNVSELHGQHQAYLEVLQSQGLKLDVLPALDEYPDSYFVEDVAIIVPEIGLITRPGAETRRNEIDFIQQAVASYRELAFIDSPGTLDGGDVLIVNKHCMVGLSERTNRAGAEQLAAALKPHGYRTDIVEVPEALHFKSSVNFLADDCLLVTAHCLDFDCLKEYKKLTVPEDEHYAANVVWINDKILAASHYPGTLELLESNGFEVIPMPVTEIEKMDGGLTCLSLRIT